MKDLDRWVWDRAERARRQLRRYPEDARPLAGACALAEMRHGYSASRLPQGEPPRTLPAPDREETMADQEGPRVEVLEAGSQAMVDEAVIQEALGEIRQRMVEGASRSAHSVGEYLLTRFFGGEPDRFYKRKKGEHPLFDALLDRTEDLSRLGLRRSTLYNCIGIHAQARALPQTAQEKIRTLPYSHQVALLPAPRERKRGLVTQAGELSVRELKSRIKDAKREVLGESRAGRPELPAFVKGLTRLKKAVEVATSGDLDDGALFAHFELDEAARLMGELDEHLLVLAALKSKVHARIEQARRIAESETLARDEGE